MSGPFFDKAYQRRAYEEEQKDKRRELSKLGPNFEPLRSPPKPAYKPRKSPTEGRYVPPMNYTSEELKERKAWIKEMRESGYSRDAYVTRVPRIDR